MPIKGMSPKEVMHKEMHEFKHGALHSGSKSGPVVKSRKQAIAIGLSEARQAKGKKPMARLSKSARSKLPAKDFAGPGRSFPVEDKKHARAAIMLSGHAKNPAAVKAKAEKVLHGGAHNPVHDGYGSSNHHNEASGFGEAIAGGKGQKHRHDDLAQNIGGKGGPHGEKESGLRSRDNPRSDARQQSGRRTGEDTNSQVENRSMEHHIAGGEHQYHEHGSGKAEHHPSVEHREPHRFHGGRVEGAHGFGHGVNRREGHLRMSGMAGAHRIGKR